MFPEISLLPQNDLCEIRLRRETLCSNGSIPPELDDILDSGPFPSFSLEPQIFAVKLVMKPRDLPVFLSCLYERELISKPTLELAKARIEVLWPDTLKPSPTMTDFLHMLGNMVNDRQRTSTQFQNMVDYFFSGQPSRYQTLVRQHLDYHLQLLHLLLSTPTGLDILSELFNSGLSIYYPSMRRGPVRHVIKNAGLTLEKSDIDKIPFSELFDRLLATFQYKMARDKSRLPLTHLVYNPFLCVFINKYALNRQKELPFNMIKRQRNLVFQLLQQGDCESVETLFPVMRFCGLSFRFIDTIMDFLGYDFSSNDTRIRAYSSVFALFDRVYDGLAVRCAKIWLQSGFSLNQAQIIKELDRQCRQYLKQFPEQFDRRKQIRAYTEHGFLQLATLMAKYLNLQRGMPVILSLAKQTSPCYRMVYFKGDAVPLDNHFIRTEGPFKQCAGVYPVIPPGEWRATIEAIHSTFHNVEKFETGLRQLEAELATALPVLTPIADCCEEAQLKLYELSIPSAEAYIWWKNLPPEQRKMNRALHHVLLNIEKRAGYPDAVEHDGITRFWGFVPSEIANQVIRSGGRIAESSLSMAGIVHGPAAHRIQMAVIFLLIEKGKIPRPVDRTMMDLARFIVDNNLWSPLLDSNLTRFSFPHFVMAWLRNAAYLPCLRQYALFSYFNEVDKHLLRHGLSDYESAVYTQLSHDWMFYVEPLDERIIAQAKGRHDFIGLTLGKDHFFYHKVRKHDRECPQPEQAATSSQSSGQGRG
ncbi:hypothetical protein [Legionella sp. CNM-4043-24]|uniref:hypothetical protein n=1 Tax=Legionella sp. CNM-4043-24 TaxID=3421646 RepID=UPI00403AA7A2